MSFFQFFGGTKKYIVSAFILAIFLPTIYFSFPQKAKAQVEVFCPDCDLSIDEDSVSNDEVTTLDIIENTFTAVATPISAANAPIQTAEQTAQHTKSFILDPIAMTLAKIIIQDITAATVKWINSGFNGNPAFVQNPEQFFIGVADQSAATYLSSTNSTWANFVCSPFSAKIRLALVQNYLSTKTPNKCSIQSIVTNWTNFGTNFYDNGGWNGWFSMTQNDQNNPIGSYIQQKDALAIQIGTQQNHYQNQLTQGNGFLSWETCANSGGGSNGSPGTGATQGSTRTVCLVSQAPDTTTTGSDGLPQTVHGQLITWSPPDYDPTPNDPNCTSSDIQVYQNGQWVSQGSSGQQIDSSTNSQLANCPSGQTQVNTPGSVIATQLGITVGSPLNQLGVAQSINQIVGALMTEMVKQVVGGLGTGGLSGLSQNSAGTQSLQAQLQTNATPSSPQFTAVQNQITSTEQSVAQSTADAPGSGYTGTGGTGSTGGAGNTGSTTAGPSITLVGPQSGPDGSDPSNPMIWQVGQAWQDPGYVAADPTDGDISSQVVIGGTIDTSTPGTYTLTYDVSDSLGIAAPEVTRTVSVQPPVTQ